MAHTGHAIVCVMDMVIKVDSTNPVSAVLFDQLVEEYGDRLMYIEGAPTADQLAAAASVTEEVWSSISDRAWDREDTQAVDMRNWLGATGSARVVSSEVPAVVSTD